MIALALAAVLVAHADSHPAPAVHSAPAIRSAPIARPPVAHPNVGVPRPVPKAPPLRAPVQALPRYVARVPIRAHVVPSPQHSWGGGAWGWNGGAVWVPSPDYWGGGFWGPIGAGIAAGDYFAYPGTPGYLLLQEYSLTQTPCGPPDLVMIFGPDGSEICTFPNDLVAPGTYSVDPETLSLVSYSPPN